MDYDDLDPGMINAAKKQFILSTFNNHGVTLF